MALGYYSPDLNGPLFALSHILNCDEKCHSSSPCVHFPARLWVSGLSSAVFPSRIGHAGNHPLTIGVNKDEQVRPAVVHFVVHQKLEWRPYHRQIVIDPH